MPLALNGRLRKVVASNWPWSGLRAGLGMAEDPIPHDDESMQISHETIYKSLFIQAAECLKKSSSSI